MRNVISIHRMVSIPETKAAYENNVGPMDKVIIATQIVKTQELPPYIEKVALFGKPVKQ